MSIVEKSGSAPSFTARSMHFVRTLDRADKRSLAGMYAFIALLHVLGFGVLLAFVVPHHYRLGGNTPVYTVGVGLLAYTFGMRHAFDADHIAAVDNTTRKLLTDRAEQGHRHRPLSVGFWFSLGHSTIVFVLAFLLSVGVKALAGPLHGGANSAVLEMLQSIAASDDGPKKFMERVKNREDGVRLMGFGHRVYKNYDPRAKIIKKPADEVLARAGGDPLLELAQQLEEIALADDYFVERKLYPNVDFYTGLIYKALGFPTNMFTVLFAVGRLPGWIAQWREMIKDPETKIGRPRQIYTGAHSRDYTDIGDR